VEIFVLTSFSVLWFLTIFSSLPVYCLCRKSFLLIKFQNRSLCRASRWNSRNLLLTGNRKKSRNEKRPPCNQGTKIGVPEVFRRIPKNSSTNICGVPRNSDSYPPNTLAIRDLDPASKSSRLLNFFNQIIRKSENICRSLHSHLKLFDFLIEKFTRNELLIISKIIGGKIWKAFFNISTKIPDKLSRKLFQFFDFKFPASSRKIKIDTVKGVVHK
jgi:hypothetical protein